MGCWGDKPWESDGALDFASAPTTAVLEAVESVIGREKRGAEVVSFQGASAVEEAIAAADLLCRVYDYSDVERAERLAVSLLPALDSAIRYLEAAEASVKEANAIRERLLNDVIKS